jgi:hypothetical protein
MHGAVSWSASPHSGMSCTKPGSLFSVFLVVIMCCPAGQNICPWLAHALLVSILWHVLVTTVACLLAWFVQRPCFTAFAVVVCVVGGWGAVALGCFHAPIDLKHKERKEKEVQLRSNRTVLLPLS